MLACAVAGLLVTSVVANAEERVCRVRATHVAGWGRHRRSGRDRLTYREGNGGWGGRIRTSVWRSQKSAALPLGDAPSGREGRRAASRRNGYAAASPIRAAGHPPVGTGGSDAPPRPAAAAAASSNRPKQVGPLPDMRASRQPGAPAERRQKIADHGQQRAGRALRGRCGCAAASPDPVCAGTGSSRRPNSSGRTAANTSAVASGWRGIDQHEVEAAGRPGRGSSSSPMPRIRAGRLPRQTRTSLPSARATSARSGAVGGRRQSRARPRRVAAASAEPPPMPEATGSRLSSRTRTLGLTPDGRGQPHAPHGARCCRRPAAARPRTARGTRPGARRPA